MGNSALRTVVIGIAVAALAPVFAQAQTNTVESKGVATTDGVAADNKAVATLRIDGGVIMVSDGGPFVSAIPNQAVVSGERLMVSKDSVATVIYNDGCEQKYEKAGVYKIEPGCARAAAVFWGGADPWKAVAIAATVVSGAAVAKMIHDDDCDCCDPVSR